MAMKDELPDLMHNQGKGAKDEREQVAAELAPLEERDQRTAQKQMRSENLSKRANQETGAIVVDNADLKIPKGVIDESSDEKRFLGIEPVVLVILGAMLLYIAFITWQISLMPPPEQIR
jgi:hypothetical protein